MLPPEPASWDLAEEAAAEVRRADPDLARRRGVHATPPALTGFVVRCVHHLLQDRLGLAAGLACSRVRLLDPAAGPANFLLEAWRVALAEQRSHHGEAAAAALLRDHLLPHSLGLELLPQPIALGRLAVRRFLAGHGLQAGRGRRLALCQADALAAPPPPLAPAPGTVAVVLGNPPFTGGLAAPGWASRLAAAWRPAGERCVRWVQSDAVRFLALAEWVVREHGAGIAALVLPHAVLTAPSFREVRRRLLATFPEVWALDLHGNKRRRERAPGGGADENLFADVALGVAVVVAVRPGSQSGVQGRAVRVFDFWGSRAQKLAALASSDVRSLAWSEARPAAPGYLLRGGRDSDRTYRRGLPLPVLFPHRSTGVVTGRDAGLIGLDRGLGEEHLETLRRQGRTLQPGDLTPFLVRPFDLRYLVYAPRLLARARPEIGGILRRGGMALLATRGGTGAPAVFATRWLAGHKVASPHEVNAVFPLHLSDTGPLGRRANLRPGLAAVLEGLYGRRPAPIAIFAYVYALLHTPAFRARHREALEEDFPRLPFPRRAGPFLALSAAGAELLRLHLLIDPRLHRPPVLPPDAQASLCPALRGYQVGGVPVLDRWLRARAGRPLGWAGRLDLARIVEALRLSLATVATLDQSFQEIAAAPAAFAEAA